MQFLKGKDRNTVAYAFVPGNPHSKNLPALVFIHGLGADASSWMHQIDYFSKEGYPMIAIDIRGHGKSQGSRKVAFFSMRRMADDLHRVIARCGYEGDCIIIGHCFGGVIAQHYQNMFPKSAKHLILISTTSRNRRKGILLFLKIFIWLFPFRIFAKTDTAKRNHREYDYWKGTADTKPERLFAAIMATYPNNYFCTLAGFSTFDNRRKLKKYNLPVDIIVGDKDSVFKPNRSYELHRLIPKSKLYIMKNVNHLIPLNAPDDLNALLDKILREK